MDRETGDPLLLGERVVAILETGLRTATYKLATLMALLQHCIETMPAQVNDVLRVPIPELAHRVLEIYWQQVRPFDGRELRQSTQPRARILIATNALRERAAVGRTGVSVDIAKLRVPQAYERAIDDVVLCLAQQPLHRLQKLPGSSTSDLFLYDDSFLHDRVSRSTLRAHGDAIELKPGIAHGLARLAGLLKPALEIMWVEDVRRMNTFLDAEVPDVAGHLFGRERTALAAVREPFKDAFGPHCFYCGTHVPSDNPIDHVLPWSLVGIDGLYNLVLSCARCNGDKSGALPAVKFVDRVLERDRDKLEQIAFEIAWPAQFDRVKAAARGIYRGQPPGVPTWAATSRASGWTSASRRGGREFQWSLLLVVCEMSSRTVGLVERTMRSGNCARGARTNADRFTFSSLSNSFWLNSPCLRRRPHAATIIHAGTVCGPEPRRSDRSVSTSTPVRRTETIPFGRLMLSVGISFPDSTTARTRSSNTSSSSVDFE